MTYPEWIKAHRQHFIEDDYNVRDMIALSLAVGWSRQEISQTLHNWPRALWTLEPEASLDRTAKQHTDHLAETIKRVNGCSLAEQWHALYDYMEYGKTWEN